MQAGGQRRGMESRRRPSSARSARDQQMRGSSSPAGSSRIRVVPMAVLCRWCQIGHGDGCKCIPKRCRLADREVGWRTGVTPVARDRARSADARQQLACGKLQDTSSADGSTQADKSRLIGDHLHAVLHCYIYGVRHHGGVSKCRPLHNCYGIGRKNAGWRTETWDGEQASPQ